MNYSGFKGVIVVGCLFLFASCVTEKEFLYLNDQIVALNKRVNGLKETTDKKVDAKLVSIREKQAETAVELGRIRDEMRQVSGRLEENNHLVKHAIERDTTAQDELTARLAALKDRVASLETRVDRINSYLGLEAGPGPDQPLKKVPALPVTKTPKKQAPVVIKPGVPPDKRLYDFNLGLYREERYEEAIGGFRNFIKKFPRSEFADNAQYWIGESYMALKQYEQAILAFQAVIKKYPKGNKVPNAILRQALAFYELKDKTSARLLLKKLVKKYPKSNEAKIAKAKLKTIK
ncbi:MAG: tol-pal system protein YbgF [Deltaproteobacteria bacterium]|nr:tol-pal system protein YbgF [Deltaproteobacteria bacterium]MBW2048922.1 tol-pal system protein YbgF [Deltaproteobacteria bacterium]MBW2352374.1 tol-pal system protein YbgF [Deltaproteobacteria bacterium]